MQATEDTNWDMVIESKGSLFDLKLREVWRYRDLLFMFVKRDFVSFYKQTILGPLWFFIQPLFTMIVFTFVFGNLAGLSTDGLPQPLFYLAGITAWNYFAECITKTSTVFKDNANIFSKVYFPRLIMPLSIVTSNLVRFAVQMLLFFGMMTYFWFAGGGFEVTSAVALFPLLVLLMALLGLGMGLIITAMTTKYRDLSFLVQFGVQLLMYATTVIYPLSSAPEQYRWILELNPMTAIIEAFRFAFLGSGEFGFYSLGYSAVVSIAILVFGVVIFNRTERDFVDTV
ncbi:MAG: ABC transporter permease [Acidobacteria bacterium]|nr:MAG: ABC transporter permease [Acidobacteriota bacterium]REK01491.1 MAG: ABC transporter permease [Acidobacteriota bacterium]REK14447.1 MAG: ABC transporter permease [Acidobacteriota bacterium]REK45162.1 MAG: ABC transporter permease [Acidobacteriota bacterium]